MATHKFHGELEALKAAVAACDLNGDWSEVPGKGLYYPKDKPDTERQPRARQNVILEMGMVMAALGRSRMVILKKGALEMPSDAAGILYIEFNHHVREIAPKLAQRLQAVGLNIDPQKIAAASA